ncbi:hypothetical protein [Halomicronema hongdechloris]|nr:hypothetical protein [Halomicronema hongdechloris]
MKLHPLLSLSIVGLGLAATPALARPEIASGDLRLDVGSQGCLDRADSFITELGVQSDSGEIDRTGYFNDGAFRILCYQQSEDQSMAIVFASHDESAEVATSFVQFVMGKLAQPDEGSPDSSPAESSL